MTFRPWCISSAFVLRTFLLIVAPCISGCADRTNPRQSTATSSQPRDVQFKSDAGAIIRALLKNTDVRLDVHQSCEGVGTDPTDETIGDYIAGFMAEQRVPENTIEAGCEPGSSGDQQCQVWFKHNDPDDEWAWGVAFEMSSSDGKLSRSSIRCLGAG
jgi:hypothetical protein